MAWKLLFATKFEFFYKVPHKVRFISLILSIIHFIAYQLFIN